MQLAKSHPPIFSQIFSVYISQKSQSSLCMIKLGKGENIVHGF